MFVISGVTGHVGSATARELLARGAQIKVLVRDEKKGEKWATAGAAIAVGSLEDEAALTAALKGASGFFVLLPPNFGAPDFYGWQRSTSDTIARAVKAAGVPHVVLLSSVGADLAEKNGPIKGLHYLENALRSTGTRLTAIRAGYFQENLANSVAPARHMGIFPNLSPSADYPMPMIATADIGKLAAESLLSPPAKSEVVDLHGPAYSIRQLAEKLGAALGKTLQVVDIAPEARLNALIQAGMPPQVAAIFDEMYGGFASGAIKPCGDRMVQGTTPVDALIPALV